MYIEIRFNTKILTKHLRRVSANDANSNVITYPPIPRAKNDQSYFLYLKMNLINNSLNEEISLEFCMLDIRCGKHVDTSEVYENN